MNSAFDKYDKAFKIKCSKYAEGDIPRTLRLFNIRIRLAIDIEINFKGQVSLTKSKEVASTYQLIWQLMEAWNAYEALIKWMTVVGVCEVNGAGKSKILTKSLLEEAGLIYVLSDAYSLLQKNFDEKLTFRRDLNEYIDRINSDINLSKTIRADAGKIIGTLKNNGSPQWYELLSLIYAERNMFYHNGEAAKMGMSYTNRILLLSIYKNTLIFHILKLAIYSLEKAA